MRIPQTLTLKWKQYQCHHYNRQHEGEYRMEGYTSYPIIFYFCPDCKLHFTITTPIPDYSAGGW